MFSSSKCSLFHNSIVFDSCIIHILYTGCAKIKKKFRRQKVNIRSLDMQHYSAHAGIDRLVRDMLHKRTLQYKRDTRFQPVKKFMTFFF